VPASPGVPRPEAEQLVGQILTLIAGAGGLSEAAIEAARAGLARAGGTPGPAQWLAPGTACDIPFSGADSRVVESRLRVELQSFAIDLAAQDAVGRRRRLLVADMESTIVTRELTDELAALADLGERVVPITARAMRGEIDFAESLRARVALLAGQPESLLERAAALVELTPGARTLVQTMKAHGAHTALVSGGFDIFAALAAARCGFDEYHANRLVIAGSVLAGRVEEPILDRGAKREILEHLAAERALPVTAAAAVGDGANDIPMIQTAGLGVAYHAKPAVRAAARFRLDHADLTGLLYLQGYSSSELSS
jgi:phosphoserine phosphatase